MTNTAPAKPEFWDRVSHILDDSDLQPSHKLTLLVVMIHEGEKQFAFPSQETIGKRVGVSERHIRRIMRELESAGFLVTEARSGRTSLSRVNWNKFVVNPGHPRPGSQNSTPDTHVLPTLDTGVLPPRTPTSYEHKGNIKKKEQDSKQPKDIDQIVRAWNDSGQPKCRQVTVPRRRALLARLKEPEWVDEWNEALERLKASSFCRGENDRRWKADFDWFIKPDTVTKLLEGKYDDAKSRSSEAPPGKAAGIMEKHTQDVLARKRAELEKQQGTERGVAS